MFQKDIYTFIDGRLDINHHRVTSLLDSIDECDAVTKQCVLEKVQKFSESIERRCFRKDIDTDLRLPLKHEPPYSYNGSEIVQCVIPKVQKCCDSIERRYLRKDIDTSFRWLL